ncbi:MAG: TonB-dependent receptor [Chitinophagaceae bacterium]
MVHLLRRIYILLFFSVPFIGYGQNPNDVVVNSILHGVVTDKFTQNGIEGANVNIKGTTNQTVTDSKGQFELKTEQRFPYVLHVALVGYKPVDIEVQDSIVHIALETDVQNLSDVVVVGYGTQKKITLTNSVSQLGAADVSRRPVSNIQQALQGYLPGVTVNDLGGSPGNSSTTIRVRGITTFNTNSSSTSGFDLGKNDALVIVDGAEQRLSDLNPNDIETVTVLKDAASTAIYGSRATNGVILVTTKAAKKGRAQVNYDGYYALQKSNNKPEQMDIKDYMEMQQVAYSNAGLTVPTKFTDSSINVWVNATDRYRYPLPNTWFETMLHTAPQQSHSLAVSGGSDIVKSRLSVRFQDQDGVIRNYGNKIAEIRLNTEYKAASRLTFNGNIDYRYNYNFYPTVDPINYFLHGSLWAVPKYPDGTYGLSTQGNNPLMYDEIGGQTKYKNDYFTGIVQGKWNILKGLDLSSYISGRAYFTQGKAFTNAYTNTDSITNITKTVANNSLTETRNELREYTWSNLLTYETRIDKHHLTGLLGYSIIDNTQSYLTAYRERFYNNDIQSIEEGADDDTKDNSGYDAEYALKSYFGRINYDYDGKYLLELNGRRDGSSKFTGNKQYGFFPSFSAGWIISEEGFWRNLKNTIQDLKFRGSYGKTGNQSVDLYSYYASLTSAGYNFNGTAVSGYRQTTLANTDLGWESTTQLDLGFDLAAFDRKLNLTVDYYRKVTNDILLNLDIPATIGLTAPYQNAGSVENKGWEFSASYKNVVGTDFHYNIAGNLSINENKVLDLKETGPYITGTDINPRYVIEEGQPINALWGYKTDGLFQTQEEIDAYGATYATGTKPGDVKYLDLNGDGSIDANDMTVIGNSFPKYTFGFNADVSYKGFELNVLFQGATKVDVRLAGALAEMGNQEGFTHKIYANNYWTPEHTDARFPRPVKYDLRNVATSDRLIINGAYLRLKNIQLAYNIPQRLLNKTFVTRLRFYVSATNLWTVSKLNEWNLDPETPSGRATYFPQTALYAFGVNLQF